MHTFLRGLFTAVLALFLVGFGICGAYGTLAGLNAVAEGANGGLATGLMLAACGLLGLAIAWGCWKAIAITWRKPAPPAE